jgi:hypothetical protein
MLSQTPIACNPLNGQATVLRRTNAPRPSGVHSETSPRGVSQSGCRIQQMQDKTETTPWHLLKNRITGLSLFEQQIQNLRSLLAEDWQIRMSHCAVGPVAAGKYPCSSNAVRVDHPSSPAFFSAC